jgi:hypothetical protein
MTLRKLGFPCWSPSIMSRTSNPRVTALNATTPTETATRATVPSATTWTSWASKRT